MSQFDSKGGTQKIGIGDGAIGQQVNNIHHHHYPRTAQGKPLQRPAKAEYFLGRDAVLQELLASMQPGQVVSICGPGGMGKTALAAQAVWALAPDNEVPALFPDGIIFYSFYGREDVSLAFAHLVRSYMDDASDTSFDAAFRLMAGKQALLILDGAEEASDLPAVLRLRGACGVLITSRKKKDALARRIDITPLEEQPAAEVFRAYSGTVGDDASVQEICAILGGWPVALRIAGRYLSSTGESAADYVRWLEDAPFNELGSSEHQQENASLLLRRSMDAVSDDARLVLGLAGCLAFAPIAREPVAATLDNDERRARNTLNDLFSYGLMDRKEERWQISHALIHTYARTELALSKESLEQLAWYYIRFCEAASDEGVKGYARLDAERAHCLRLIESCLESKRWQEVKRLVRVTYIYLDRQGYWTELLAAIEMNLTAAQQAGDRKDEGWCLNSLGYTYWRRGEYEKALSYYEQGLPIYCEVGNRQGEGAILNNIAAIYDAQDKYALALQHYQQSLTIKLEIGDRGGEGTTLNNIAGVYNAQGNYEQALQHYEQCLLIRREISDKIGESITMNNIALIYDAQRNPAKALEYYEQALAIHQQLGDRAGEAETRWNIGATYYNIGNLAKAEKHISQAVQVIDTICHPELEKYRKGLALVRALQRGNRQA
jgi:tetratricopeptide (TPR) repeat protein